MVIAQINGTVLDATDVGAPIPVQRDTGLVSLPPIGTTTADTPSQIMEQASYGVTSDPSLTIGSYQPSSNYANNIQGLVQGLFGQLPAALGESAMPLSVSDPLASPGAVNRSPLLLVGIGLVALSVLAFRK